MTQKLEQNLLPDVVLIKNNVSIHIQQDGSGNKVDEILVELSTLPALIEALQNIIIAKPVT